MLTAEFVAEARRVYIPAIRWARANGWDTPRLRNRDRSVEIHVSDVYDGAWDKDVATSYTLRPSFLVIRRSSALREQYYPMSIAQAIDFLVTAGVLPDAFHSIHASYVPEIDQVGDRVGVRKWSDQREVHWLEPATEEPEGWEPLFRRVTEPAGSVTT